jgi:glycosyltransferase involved in cell wall biosynthesis
MKLLFALTYYRPHVSGLTIYVQRLAEALAQRGHRVTVLTSRYDAALPTKEQLNGVRVVRVPVAFRVSKGGIMPSYPTVALRLMHEHDVVAANLPNTPVEALSLPSLARLAGRPITMTYHCDLNLPSGVFNRVVDQVVFLSNLAAASLADQVVAYTEDYATHSRVLRRFRRKRVVIPPPVDMPIPSEAQVAAFKERFGLNERRVIGFVARFATEKGVEYALRAIPLLCQELPNVRILFAGEYRRVIGEEAYWERLQPLLREWADHWQFTGVLDPTDPAELASFYAACDLTILPSINMTESFGLVQVESMLCGTPVVASNLPGVRQPVRVTGMGQVVPLGDERALAEAILEIVRRRAEYVRPRGSISAAYSTARTAEEYERLFESLLGQSAPAHSASLLSSVRLTGGTESYRGRNGETSHTEDSEMLRER